MNVLIVVVPRYGAFTMTLTGWTMLFACSVYYWMLPHRPLEIHFEGAIISLCLGWCFWINILAGMSNSGMKREYRLHPGKVEEC